MMEEQALTSGEPRPPHVTSLALVGKNTIFVGHSDGVVRAFRLDSGELFKEYTVPTQRELRAAAAEGKVEDGDTAQDDDAAAAAAAAAADTDTDGARGGVLRRAAATSLASLIFLPPFLCVCVCVCVRACVCGGAQRIVEWCVYPSSPPDLFSWLSVWQVAPCTSST